MLPNGCALSCGVDNYRHATNETSSCYQLSIKHKTYARHEFRTHAHPVGLSAWLGGTYDSSTNASRLAFLIIDVYVFNESTHNCSVPVGTRINNEREGLFS